MKPDFHSLLGDCRAKIVEHSASAGVYRGFGALWSLGRGMPGSQQRAFFKMISASKTGTLPFLRLDLEEI
jgi:hypothetical protein